MELVRCGEETSGCTWLMSRHALALEGVARSGNWSDACLARTEVTLMRGDLGANHPAQEQ